LKDNLAAPRRTFPAGNLLMASSQNPSIRNLRQPAGFHQPPPTQTGRPWIFSSNAISQLAKKAVAIHVQNSVVIHCAQGCRR
jgi:hypothetical protein